MSSRLAAGPEARAAAAQVHGPSALDRLQRLLRLIVDGLVVVVKLLLLGCCCMEAYRIRLHAVKTFGYIIHEFDPWFNFRAAQYLAKSGWYRFFHWYDYMSWYPLGRPIGTTIYPGMQITAVAIWKALKRVPTSEWRLSREVVDLLPKRAASYLPGKGTLKFGPMSLNDVCCMVPAWYGALATLLLGMLTAEVSGSTGAGLAAAFVMSIIPAHMMRSVAGEFDNECVAVAAFCLTFYLWCRSLRTRRSWPVGVLAGLAYVYAVATWGGYIFVINLVGVHALVIVAVGKYNSSVYRAYTLFYSIGTAGATFVPVVGWTPLRSVEQIGPLGVFIAYQILEVCDICRRRFSAPKPSEKLKGMWHSAWGFFCLRIVAFLVAGLALVVVAVILLQFNYFAPMSSRIRGLFIKHQRTGNPLVDSVAEHQPGSARGYEHYLHKARYVAVAGLLLCWHQRTPAKFFPVIYAAVAFHFSLKMSRLMIICGPIVAMLAGIAIGIPADWVIEQFVSLLCGRRAPAAEEDLPHRTGGMGSIIRAVWPLAQPFICPREVQDIYAEKERFRKRWSLPDRLLRAALAGCLLAVAYREGIEHVKEFYSHCHKAAFGFSNARIVFESKDQQGRSFIVDDYLVGYKWLKKNTPADARVMAWWDYGYQITGVGNRTSIADGNTWNHEHIATLGRTLTNPEKKAHNIMRHLADFVLVWAGGRSDDMAKSPHLARIANSIYPEVCGESDPKCTKFGIHQDGSPTKMMAGSFLYKAVNHGLKDGVKLSDKLFKEVYKSKYGLLRIFEVRNVSEESKRWIADPANRICDAPGSWYCVGQYPPALAKLIASRRNFAQLEDFNKKGAEKSAYTKMVEKNQREGNAEL